MSAERIKTKIETQQRKQPEATPVTPKELRESLEKLGEKVKELEKRAKESESLKRESLQTKIESQPKKSEVEISPTPEKN
jgi:uncharacterized protein YlxW (UPF0749 family)